jgi:cyclin B/cyclin A
MFMASKYEDVFPLLMKTVFNKIGHKKFAIEDIRSREMDILRVLGFKIGGYPTALEFLTSYLEQVMVGHKDRDFVEKMTIYLAKMSLHHEKLCTKQSNLLGASSIYVALKICE